MYRHEASLYGSAIEALPDRDHLMIRGVLNAADAIELGAQLHAQRLLRRVLDDAASSTAAQRLARIFAEGLQARLSSAIDTSAPEVDPRDLALAYHRLLWNTPLLRYGYTCATEALVRALPDAPRLHIVDIGIGAGTQWLLCFNALATQYGKRPQIRLTAIDLPEPGAEPERRLREVGASLSRHARALGLSFAFEPLAVPLQHVDTRMIRRDAGEALIINAACTLQQVAPGSSAPTISQRRDEIVRQLRALDPQLLTLIEPALDHQRLALLPRIRVLFAHYLSLFDALETLMPAWLAERALIERAIFGREIFESIAGASPYGIACHERYGGWRERLRREGFAPVDMTQLAQRAEYELDLDAPFAIQRDESTLWLAWKDRRLLAASAWRLAA
jgi:GRAS domain family